LQQSYDGDRLRGKKTDNGTTTYYLRSSVLGGQVIAEMNGSGTFTRGYVYLGGQLLAVQQNSAVSWVHQDPVTKSQRVTNAAGSVVSTIELDPWGGNTSRNSNDAFQPRKFTTYERDGNASDEAMHRRYNRWWSRFDQPDPYDGSYSLTNPQSFNRYAYVQNDPVNFVDPSGLMMRECGTNEFGDPIYCTATSDTFADRLFGIRSRFAGHNGDRPRGGGPGPGTEDPQEPVATTTPQDDCHRFADLVAGIAGRNDTAEGFMDEMARTFTAANNSSRAAIRGQLDGAVPPGRTMLGDGGFRDSLRDGTGLQVRHFVGGLLYGYRYGYGTMVPATALEAISPAPAGSMADVRLNELSMRWGTSMEPRPPSVTGYMGATIRTPAHPGYRGLADLIRRDICQ